MASAPFQVILNAPFLQTIIKVKSQRLTLYNEFKSCLNLIHALQEERGMAVLFLRGKTKRNPAAFEEKTKELDKILEEIEDISLPSPIASKKKRFIKKTRFLKEWREEIRTLTALDSDIIDNYAEEMITPALSMTSDLMIHEGSHAPNKVGALSHLLNLQEHLALERDMGIIPPEPNTEKDKLFIQKLSGLIAEQQAYERLFWALADEPGRQIYANVKTTHTSGNLGDDINTAILEGNALPMLRYYTELEWFTIFSAKIEAIHKATQELASTLINELSSIPEQSIQPVPLLSTDMEGHIDDIKNLPLFQNIASSVFRQILRASRITSLDKNNVILAQGENATTFDIILEGWIKISKTTPDGEEAILHIAGKGESLIEADPINLTPTSIIAKTVTKTKTLAIPIKIINEQIRKEQELALNITREAMDHLQKMSDHFEQVTIRTAQERVGWFLLNLHIKGGSTGFPITLPFDKSLIAAYLNIKPETFSRALQGLRKKGFKIEKQKIHMPTPHALCEFCDSEKALKCCNAIIHSCFRPEIQETGS